MGEGKTGGWVSRRALQLTFQARIPMGGSRAVENIDPYVAV